MTPHRSGCRVLGGILLVGAARPERLAEAELDSKLLDFCPHDVTGRRWWHDERLPGSKVGGAVRVVGRRVQQRLPVHGTVVILVDENPDLVVGISRILPEE